jgi:hypothetical protein
VPLELGKNLYPDLQNLYIEQCSSQNKQWAISCFVYIYYYVTWVKLICKSLIKSQFVLFNNKNDIHGLLIVRLQNVLEAYITQSSC